MSAGMEFFFNFVWLVTALVLILQWCAVKPRVAARRRNSVIALAMLIAILFPVISVSDDLWSIQNPAETDTALRRDHLDHAAHSVLPVIAGGPVSPFAGLEHKSASGAISSQPALIPAYRYWISNIQNRPPPAV